jgi:hypothetical protein
MTETEFQTESMIAEPPSTVAGDEGEAAADVDVQMGDAETEDNDRADKFDEEEAQAEGVPRHESPPEVAAADATSRDEALLPPPPDQVGNISSPKADYGHDRVSDGEERSRGSHNSDSAPILGERPPLQPHDSAMTEDTIKPEDSASVRFPLTESGAPSEVGTASAEDTKETAVVPAEAIAEEPKEASPSEKISPVDSPREGPPAFADQGASGELDELTSSKDDAPKDASPSQSDPSVAARPEPEASPSITEPQPVSAAKSPTPPSIVRGPSHDEAPAALEQLEEPPREEADASVEEPTIKPDVDVPEKEAEQHKTPAEEHKEDAEQQVKDEPMEEPSVESVSEPAPEPVVPPAEAPAEPTPPAAASEPTTSEAAPGQAEEAGESKEDQPASM